MKIYTLKSFTVAACLCTASLLQAQNSGTSPYGTFFQFTTSQLNQESNWNNIDHPELNGNPTAYPIYTHNYNPNAGSGTYCDFPQGIWYPSSPGNWAIYSQDYSTFDTLPDGADYNILIPSGAGTSMLWSDSASASNNWMYVDHASLNGNPNAIFFAVPAYEPNSVYQTQSLGVWYDDVAQQWGIFNQDGITPMDAGAGFHVFIPDASSEVFVHTADTLNTSSNYTNIDNAALNGDSTKTIIITQNWNPAGTGSVYNNNEVGVWYNIFNGQWSIYNESLNNMPIGASFNVLVLNHVTGTDDLVDAAQLKAFPNPATEHVILSYSLNTSSAVSVTVSDLMGRVITRLDLGEQPAGAHSRTMSVSDFNPGIYNCTMEIGDRIANTTIVVQ